ncbi:uncharacterized protein LOC144442315 [Glandiceps talaboti]
MQTGGIGLFFALFISTLDLATSQAPTPTIDPGDTDGECASNPCGVSGTDYRGPCFNRPMDDPTEPQYVCECPHQLYYMGYNCDEFAGPLNDKWTCFGMHCWTGSMSSPNYPNLYISRHRKLYLIYIPGATSVTFTGDPVFEVETHKDEMHLGQGLVYPLALPFENKTTYPVHLVYQGNTAPKPLTLGGNAFWSVFDTDKSREYKGWKVDWTASEQQKFTVEPISITATEGANVTFQCSVKDKFGVMSWIKDDYLYLNYDLEMNVTETRYSIISEGNNSIFNLFMWNVGAHERGTYKAYVSARYGHVAIETAAVTLTVHTAAIQSFIQVPNDTVVVEGRNAVLTCQILNKEGTVIWSKNGFDISSDNTITNGNSRYSIVGNHAEGEYHLAVVHAELSDDAAYSVRVTAADNSAELRSGNAQLTVRRRQAFTRTPDAVTIVEGNTLTLYVTVSNKHGTLSWRKNGALTMNSDLSVAVNDARISISGGASSGVYNLVITDVRLSDAGSYSVIVTGGSIDSAITTDPITVTVHDIATQEIVKNPSSVNISASDTVILELQIVHKEGDAIWSKDGQDISMNTMITNSNSRFSIVGDSSIGEYNLRITDISAIDEGYYQARVTEADNSPEVRSLTAVVNVTDPISPLANYPQCSWSIIDNSQTLQLTCESQGGSPSANLQWTQNGDDVPSILSVSKDPAMVQLVVEMPLTYSLQGLEFVCVSNHVMFSAPKSCSTGRINTGILEPPHDGYPKCTITNEHLIKDDSTLLVCESRGGLPPATLEWSRDGVAYEGQWLDSATGFRRLGLQLNLTSDLEGATFVCTSHHQTYDEAHYCEIGPLEYEGLATGIPWWFWLLLFLLLLALLIILILLICCCCCCRRRKVFFCECCGDCLDKCLAKCPCFAGCGCCYVAKEVDDAEVAVIERGVLISETGAGAPLVIPNGYVNSMTTETQTPGYLYYDNIHYVIQGQDTDITKINISKTDTEHNGDIKKKSKVVKSKVEDSSNIKKGQLNSTESRGTQKVDDIKNQHGNSHSTTTNIKNVSIHTTHVHGREDNEDDDDDDEIDGEQKTQRRVITREGDDNKQDGRLERLDNTYVTLQGDDNFVIKKKDDEEGDEDTDEIDGHKDPENMDTSLRESHSVQNRHWRNFFSGQEGTDNVLSDTASESITSDEELQKLRREEGTKEIIINGGFTMSGITQDELFKLARFRDSLGETMKGQSTLSRTHSQKSSTSRNSTLQRSGYVKQTTLNSSSMNDGHSDGRHRHIVQTLSTNLKRRPYRITPDPVRWGKTQPEALARELGTERRAISDGEDESETLHTLRSMRFTTDCSMFTASAWKDEAEQNALVLTSSTTEDSQEEEENVTEV